MKKFAVMLGVAVLATSAMGADLMLKTLEWSYPNVPDPKIKESGKTFTAAGAPVTMKLTMTQINNPNAPPDWFPKEHGPVPKIVSIGKAPKVRACMQCHLVHGGGKPESANIQGLSVKYIMDQTHAFRDGNRNNSRSSNMVTLAKEISDADLLIAARYYAALKPPAKRWVRVVEAERAPASHVEFGGGRFYDDGPNSKKTVPIPPNQIFEIAESDEVKLRNPRVGFVAYVPKGSIEKGRVVALGNRGRTRSCASCHGENLRGSPDGPPLAGRSPTYMVRQMSDMKVGARKGPALGQMKDIIAKMSAQDMTNVAAYMASLNP
jgi:cytochrome c553